MPTPRVLGSIVGILVAVPFGLVAAPDPGQAASQPPSNEKVVVQKSEQAPAKSPSKGAPKPKNVSLRMAEGLRFDPPRFEAKPGELLAFNLENVDISHQPHNFVIVQPGMVEEVVKLSMEMAASGASPGALPKHPGIIASSADVINPESKAVLQFKVPETAGVYGYVCTVPGHGVVMYGAMYVGVPMPLLSKDTNIPQVTLEKGLAGGGKRPFVQRLFMPNSGPASIGVALPGTQNYCFDSAECRVRYAWSGLFMDGSQYWRGSGKELAELGDAPWWTSEAFPLRFKDRELKAADFKFLGYSLKGEFPEFHFKVGPQEVFESVQPSGNGILLKFRLPGISSNVVVRMDSSAYWSCPEGVVVKGGFRIPAAKAGEFSVLIQPKEAFETAVSKTSAPSASRPAPSSSNP